jgi:hypothetical protein
MTSIFEGNYDWGFLISLEVFSDHQTCIYGHSIFIEQINLVSKLFKTYESVI